MVPGIDIKPLFFFFLLIFSPAFSFRGSQKEAAEEQEEEEPTGECRCEYADSLASKKLVNLALSTIIQSNVFILMLHAS